jgi:hypothetical protein
MSRSLLPPAALLVALACTPTGPVDTATAGESQTDATTSTGSTTAPGSTGSDSATSTTSPTTTTTSESTTTEPTSGTGSTTGVQEQCLAELPQDQSGSPVEVTVRNARQAPIFVLPFDGCNVESIAPFALIVDGAPLDFKEGGCDFGCDLVPSDQCGCREFCPDDAVLVLQPGASFTKTWDGGAFTEAPTPPSCEVEVCAETCTVRAPAPAGKYTVAATATEAIDCTGGPDECTCTPNADGWCWLVFGTYELADAPFETLADLSVPADTAVEVVFE